MPLAPRSLFFSLIALMLAVTLPVLGAHHFLPIATFHQEWLAFALGLAAFAPLAFIRGGAVMQFPRIFVLPLGLILLVWIQVATDLGVRFEQATLLSLYLTWALMLMVTTLHLQTALGQKAFGDALARGLLCGALALAATGIAQRWLPEIGQPWIFSATGVISGNLAQPNNFADYCWLGIVCAIHLLRRPATFPSFRAACVPAIPLLAALSLLSGSRSVYFYAVAVTLWSLWLAARTETPQRRTLQIAGLALIPLLLLLQLALGQGEHSVTSAQRIVEQGSYDPVRLTLWRAALAMFSEHPLLGSGYDSYSREFFTRIADHPINGVGIPEHSHNLFTEIGAEFGLGGLLLLLVTGWGWMRAALRQREPTTQLAIGLLLVLGIHSMLEYPLWYAHFLAIATIALAAGDARRLSIALMPRHRMLAAIVLLAGAGVLWGLRADYVSLEEAAHGRSGDGTALTAEEQNRRLARLYERSLLSPYAAMQFAVRMPIAPDELSARLGIVSEVVRFSPIRQAVFREAALLYLDGRQEEAQRALTRAMLGYPAEIDNALALFESDPAIAERIAPLCQRLRQRSF